MKKQEDWTYEEWRDYYRDRAQKAFVKYQEAGDGRDYRTYVKNDVIADAFTKAIAYRSEVDEVRMRRRRNIDAYLEKHPIETAMTGEDVRKIITDIRDM